MKKKLFTLIAILISSYLPAQNTIAGIGQWRDYLPYGMANSVSIGGDIIYCASQAAFISYNQKTREITRRTTINGLNDIGIRMLKFNDYTNSLLIVYNNGNIDLIVGNKIINIPAIKESELIGDKSINNIRFDKEYAYLSCGFGIVLLNMKRLEVKDTYLIGLNSELIRVNDVYVNHEEDRIYAASEEGVYFAHLTENLSDYNSWNKLNGLPDGEFTLVNYFANTLLMNYKTGRYDTDIVYGFQDGQIREMVELGPGENHYFDIEESWLSISKNYNILRYDQDFERDALFYAYDTEGKYPMSPAQAVYRGGRYVIADKSQGLVEMFYQGEYKFIKPDGPNSVNINNIDIYNDLLWSAEGLMSDGYRSSENYPNFNRFSGNKWESWSPENSPELTHKFGYIKIAINPFNPNQVFSGSWSNGLIEFRNDAIYEQYDATNQLKYNHKLTGALSTDLIKIGGLVFDEDENLWMTNSETPYCLVVKTKDDVWYNFNLGLFVDEFTVVGDLIVTEQGHKWILLNRENRIIVFDDNGTPDNTSDDRSAVLTPSEGNGNIPGGTIHCLVEDQNGAIWIGTDEGPAVFYNPGSVFDGGQDAQQIFVEQDGQTQILLETEEIRTIAVDGANRKWFGTSNSGVFLMSEDGTREINHFTFKNSPLFSDDIKDIGINHGTGEVFFCTGSGLISYRGTATKGGDEFGRVSVFPNPVTKGYSGLIAINGLAQNANVKITDIGGLLIYETKAFGGQAVWDGNSLTGNKAKNGVYLIFSTDNTGEYQNISKLLYLNN